MGNTVCECECLLDYKPIFSVRIVYFIFECDAHFIILVQYYVFIVILEEIPKNTAYQVNTLNVRMISFNIQKYLSISSNSLIMGRYLTFLA